MKIFCIGRNYVAHALELNSEVPAEPVFFMKPDTALLLDNRPFPVPEWSRNLHHEIELLVRISKDGANIPRENASDYYREIGIGIDFTARDIQDQLKDKGLPWEKCKAFDNSAAVGTAFIPKQNFEDLKMVSFRLDVNGTTRQNGNSGLMIFSFEDIISNISRYITLKKGDLIYTGTPAGVGPVKPGDHLEGFLGEHKLLDFWIT